MSLRDHALTRAHLQLYNEWMNEEDYEPEEEEEEAYTAGKALIGEVPCKSVFRNMASCLRKTDTRQQVRHAWYRDLLKMQ